MDWTIGGVILGVISLQTVLFLWMMSKLDSDIRGVSDRIDGAHKRIDAMGTRIDATQAAIMRMLEKQGR